MSDTLRYLNEGGDKSNEAAQSFLKNKLDKGITGRYTKAQYEQLMGSGGPAVVNASDGAMPGGPAYEADRKVISKGSSAPDGFYETGWRAGKKSGEIDWTDSWNDHGFQQIRGKGAVNEDYRARYAELEKSGSDVDDHGAGWMTLKSQDTMGSSKEFKALAEEWQNAGFDVRVQDMEGIEGTVEANFAVRPGAGKLNPEVKEEMKPIEHSPEVRQATERVRTFENDVMAGKTSDDIFGIAKNNNYVFDHNKGSEGIGTSAGASSNVEGRAAASFLDSKKSEVKDKYQFKPAN